MNNFGAILIFNSAARDQTHEDNCLNYYIERRYLRDRYNVLDMASNKFLESFRVSKDIFRYLITQIEPCFQSGTRITKVHVEVKLAAVLNFLATGSYQITIGDLLFHNIDKSMLSRSITELTGILENPICRQYVKFPSDARTKQAYKQRFFEKTGHPGVIGCIDGTHINILAPKENEHIYVDSRGNHSMNVQLICNYDLLIMSVCARFPGSTHDASIWEMSQDREELQNNYDNGERNTFLLGDSGYPLEPYLMTPYRNANERQTIYNNLHTKSRNPVERCIGVLKNTFRCLLGERMLQYEPTKVVKIVNVCAALYSICLLNKLQMVELPLVRDNEDVVYEGEFEYEDANQHETARSIRDGILNCF